MCFEPFDDYLGDYLGDYPDDEPGTFVDTPPGQIAGLKWLTAMNDRSVVVVDGLVYVVD